MRTNKLLKLVAISAVIFGNVFITKKTSLKRTAHFDCRLFRQPQRGK